MIESSETKYINDQLVERRYQAGRPYHKPRSRHDVSRREDHIFAVVLIFVTGAMCGATVALMWGAARSTNTRKKVATAPPID